MGAPGGAPSAPAGTRSHPESAGSPASGARIASDTSTWRARARQRRARPVAGPGHSRPRGGPDLQPLRVEGEPAVERARRAEVRGRDERRAERLPSRRVEREEHVAARRRHRQLPPGARARGVSCRRRRSGRHYTRNAPGKGRRCCAGAATGAGKVKV